MFYPEPFWFKTIDSTVNIYTGETCFQWIPGNANPAAEVRSMKLFSLRRGVWSNISNLIDRYLAAFIDLVRLPFPAKYST